jgi:heterotetrameric sarcosine oxidase gamma subunit
VPEHTLTARAGLEHLAIPGRHGRPDGSAGVMIALRRHLALATVMARKGQHDDLARRIREAFGLEVPTAPRRAAAGPIAFAWAGPGHWLAVAHGMEGDRFETQLRTTLQGLASVTSQSDGRTVIRVSGPKARDALAKGVPIDLHPRAFKPGDTAVTTVAYMGAHLWQLDATPTYEFAVFRSFSVAFWQWLMDASAEFGADIE